MARLAAFMYLVPPLVAVEAYFLFGDRLQPWQLAGMALATRK